MHPTLNENVALITGGAKRVGQAIALRLAEAGMDIAFTFNTSDTAAAATRQRIERLGRRAEAIRVDLTQPDAVDRLFERFNARFGRLDALINNAASFEPTPLGQITPDRFHEPMTLNAVVPLMLIQAFSGLLSAGFDRSGDSSQAGRVVNLVDEHVLGTPLRNFLAYNASKAALTAITRSCALELAPKITVNGVAPGVVAWNDTCPDDWQKQYLARVPLGGGGGVDDVAAAVLFLIRDAGFCTGQIIPIEGGRSLT